MIEKFKSIFIGLDRAHGVTKVSESNGNGKKIKGVSFIKREPVTDDLWQKHLNGTDSLGVIPINDDNNCKWGCIDIDSYACLLYTSPSPRDGLLSRMPSSA